MVPALTPLARAAAARATRSAHLHPNGLSSTSSSRSNRHELEFTPILKPLEPYKDSLVIVKNLTRSHPGSQVGDHWPSASAGI